jgi:hypothetical protein
MSTLPPIPPTFPVQPVDPASWPGDPRRLATCGACGRTWDDDPDEPTAWTPAPAARCPFESWHADDEEAEPGPDDIGAVWALTRRDVADTLDALEAADVAACSWCDEATDGELARTGAGEHDDECPMAGGGRFAELAGELRRLAGIAVDDDAHAWVRGNDPA